VQNSELKPQYCPSQKKTLGRLRLKDHKFKTSLGYIVRACLRKLNKQGIDRFVIFSRLTVIPFALSKVIT
jgi:hypothetical protein